MRNTSSLMKSIYSLPDLRTSTTVGGRRKKATSTLHGTTAAQASNTPRTTEDSSITEEA